MRAGLWGLVGAGLGFVAFGPLGAVVGGVAAYAADRLLEGPEPVRASEGWAIVASSVAVPPSLLESWAKSSGVTVRFALQNTKTGTPYVAMVTGKTYGAGTEQSGRRYFLVDPVEYNAPTTGGLGLPSLNTRWKVYDSELIPG